MDFMLSSIVLFLGASFLFSNYSEKFKNSKTIQLIFFTLSLLLILAGFVTLHVTPQINYIRNNTGNITTEYYSIPTAISGISGAIYSGLLGLLIFMVALMLIYILYDSILMIFNKKGDDFED